jgi:hypothetical protein
MKHNLFITTLMLLMINSQAQNVGIGTNNPIYPLQVTQPNLTGTALNLHNNSSANGGHLTLIRFTNSDMNHITGLYSSVIGGGRVPNSSESYLIFGTSMIDLQPQEKMRLSGNGYLGIGTDAPQGRLHIKGTTPISAILESSSPTGTFLSIGNTTNNNWFQLITTGVHSTLGAAKLLLTKNTGPSIFLDNPLIAVENATGNVGINHHSPLNKLDVNGAAVIGEGLAGINTAPVNGLLVQGNIGAGTATAAVQLQVNGAIASTSSQINITGGAQTVNPGNKSYIRIYNTDAVNAVITLGDGLADGQILYVLTVTNNTGRIQFFDNINNNTQLNSSFLMDTDDTLTLIWDATFSKWIELHRSVN